MCGFQLALHKPVPTPSATTPTVIFFPSEFCNFLFMPQTQCSTKDSFTLLSSASEVKYFVPSWVKINIANALKWGIKEIFKIILYFLYDFNTMLAAGMAAHINHNLVMKGLCFNSLQWTTCLIPLQWIITQMFLSLCMEKIMRNASLQHEIWFYQPAETYSPISYFGNRR